MMEEQTIINSAESEHIKPIILKKTGSTLMSINSSRLNASPDAKHFSYKVLGLISWSVLLFCLFTLLMARRLFLDTARLVAIYMMVRFIIFTVFYLAGLVIMRRKEKESNKNAGRVFSRDEISLYQKVHHLVVLPNFNEPQGIINRTLHALRVQSGAGDNLTVVLGIEEQEPDVRDKVETLLAGYKGSFQRIMATFHPANLPGEAAGKGTNESWAVRRAREELVERLGIPADSIVVTVIDSDSLLHPHYMAELTRQFSVDPHRHCTIWQPPILLDNNIWQTHAVIRLLTYFSNAITMGDYFNPWATRFPYSSYSLSLKLLEELNYWDPTVIAEDVDIFMRSFFGKGGKASIRHIPLPVHGNPVYGADLWQAISIFFTQKVRQGWGGAEIGYLIQKWSHPPGAPFFQKLGRLLNLIHDHLFFSTAGFIVALGTVLSILLDHNAVITLPSVSFSPLLFIILNFLGGLALVIIWLSEHARLSSKGANWNMKNLPGEIAAWLIFPVLFFLMMNVPGMLAQTQMLLGKPIRFYRTPKGLHSKLSD
jgi:cellulose synthase/poly-beta-1,6-N-acetylglucosamine synthase-like glycosyltransferase